MKRASLIALAAFAAAPAFAAPAPSSVPAATVPGVTLQSVRLGKGYLVPGSNASQAVASTAYADADGKTLYTYDKDQPGKSLCVGECAAAWPPLAAPADAKPVGDWSVIARDDGSKQWAHDGKPLYTFAKDKALGSSAGHNADGVWHAAILDTPAGLVLPTEITVDEILTAPGLVLVDARGMPLYAFDAKAKGGKDLKEWEPVRASALARGVGNFSVVKRSDGIAQWAYQGKALYTYKWDVEKGDANGKTVDARFQIALVRSYFMPAGVNIRLNQKRGGVLATTDDHTLYARDRTAYTGNGAHNARGGAKGSPLTGLAVALTGCDAACEKTWVPLKAPANAVAEGYWNVFTRADGSKQWGYQGYALYSYTGEKPGEVTANDMYDFAISRTPEQAIAANGAALGLYWRVTSP